MDEKNPARGRAFQAKAKASTTFMALRTQRVRMFQDLAKAAVERVR